MVDEYFDLLDEQGNKTGKTKLRSAVHRDGDWHAAVNIFIVNSEHDILLQRRADDKDSYPGKLDISCGGHLVVGDDIVSAAVRELNEELSLIVEPHELEFVMTFRSSTRPAPDFINNSFNSMFILRRDLDPKSLKLQASEVSAAFFVPLEKLKAMQKSRDPDLVPHDKMYTKLFEICAQ